MASQWNWCATTAAPLTLPMEAIRESLRRTSSASSTASPSASPSPSPSPPQSADETSATQLPDDRSSRPAHSAAAASFLRANAEGGQQRPQRQRRQHSSNHSVSHPVLSSTPKVARVAGDSGPVCHAPASASKWVDEGSLEALCQLTMDDRRGGGDLRRGRRALPPGFYSENIAPFLRFEAPLPNMLYAFGGRNQGRGPLDLVEMFDTWNGCWKVCPAMPTRRAGSTAAVLPDGRIIVVGGYNEKGIAEGLLSSCDIYDPVRRSWAETSSAAPLARARWGHGCATLRGQVYVVGGCSLQLGAQPREAFMETLRSCEVYDPVENKWSSAAPLQIARSGSRVVALAGDRYLAAIGGCDDVFGRAETQPTVELFDAETGTWTLLESRLQFARTTAAAVAVSDRRVLVVGGAPSLASAELYDVQVPVLPAEGHEQEGGASSSSSVAISRDEERGDAAEGQEQQSQSNLPPIADMREGRMGCQAVVLNLPGPKGTFPLTDRSCAVVVGGERCDEGTGDVPRVKQFKNAHIFDISTNSWREDEVIPEMSVPRTAAALCVAVGHVVP